MSSIQFWRKYKIVLLVFLSLFTLDVIIWSFILFSKNKNGSLELYFLDVGQGDSQLVNLPGGVQILIDGGPPNARVLSELSKILPTHDTYIDLVIMSHPQLDHFGGLIDVLKKYQVGAFIASGRKGETGAYQELISILKIKKIPYVALGEGDTISYGDNRLLVLSPGRESLLSPELNDTSLVFMLESSGIKSLYTGDIGMKMEEHLAEKYSLKTQVLKVAHHGSKFSSSPEFLAAVSPRVSIIGVGKNSYGHPTKEVLDRLEQVPSRILRTDEDGTIKIAVFDKALMIFKKK